jgi:hypothetical protein
MGARLSARIVYGRDRITGLRDMVPKTMLMFA